LNVGIITKKVEDSLIFGESVINRKQLEVTVFLALTLHNFVTGIRISEKPDTFLFRVERFSTPNVEAKVFSENFPRIYLATFTLQPATKAQKGSRGIALLLL